MAAEPSSTDLRPPHLDRETWIELRLRLEHERRRLLALLAEESKLPDLPERGEPADFGDLAIRHGLDDASESLHAIRHGQLFAVERALARMEAGTYGINGRGEPIPIERLRALPWATF